jgi:hypothetical protein
MAAVTQTADDVAQLLQRYADRGVFRSFSAVNVRGGKRKFCFEYPPNRHIELLVDPKNGSLALPRLLPNAPADSQIYRDLKSFVVSRQQPQIPEHRRIDPKRATAKCTNRKGSVAITVSATNGDLEYACRCAVKLVSEIFLGFLNGPYAEYMFANFDQSEE